MVQLAPALNGSVLLSTFIYTNTREARCAQAGSQNHTRPVRYYAYYLEYVSVYHERADSNQGENAAYSTRDMWE